MSCFLQREIASAIRSAQSATEAVIPDVAASDRVRLRDLLDGVDERAADVLAWACRMPEVFDAMAQVAQVARLRQQLAERGVGT
jgi:hypothetical protein